MKINFYKFLSICFIFLLLGCNKNKIIQGKVQNKDECTLIYLNPSNNNKFLLSEFIHSIKIIPLETDSSSLLAHITKIEYDDNNYFVGNSYDQFVYVFDAESGAFQNKIGAIGQGPGEMIFPGPYAIHTKEKEVWLGSNFKEIYKYDYKGNFIEKIPLKLFYQDFYISPDNENIYFYTSKKINYSKSDMICYELWIRDKNGNFTTFFPYDPEHYPNGGPLFFSHIPFNLLNKDIIFHYLVSDTIYQINDKKIVPKYIINYLNSKSSIDLNTSNNIKEFIKSNNKGAGVLFDVIETENYLTFGYLLDGKEQKVIYNKSSNILKEGEYNNDLFNLPLLFMGNRNDKLIGVINYDDSLILTEKMKKLLDDDSLNLLLSLKEESNPIIIEFELNL